MKRKIPIGRNRSATLFLVGLILTGCGGKEQRLVLATPSVTAPPILRSEADQIAIPLRVDAPIRFENRSSVEQQFSVSKTGCSCYGMATAESLLKTGEQISVPPRGSKELFFVAKEPQAASEQAFRAAFQAGPISGSSSPSASQELRADCSMKIFPDLVLDPASIVVDLPTSGDAASESQNHAVTITRVTRGKPADSVPAFVMSPALLKSEPARQDKPPEEISAGLWRTIWRTSMKPDQIPAGIRESGGRFAFTFELPEGDLTPNQTGNPPRDGQIPTILDFVTSNPQRKVTGQLILRRSKGIIVPAQLHFGAIPAGSSERTRRLVLSAADHRPFQVTVGEVPAQFSADADSSDAAEQQWITVTFQPGVAGESQGKLTLKTTHPDQPVVQITLKARVQ